jgi:hypothetical protein
LQGQEKELDGHYTKQYCTWERKLRRDSADAEGELGQQAVLSRTLAVAWSIPKLHKARVNHKLSWSWSWD